MKGSYDANGAPCAALVGDLVRSREHSDQRELFAAFAAALEATNAEVRGCQPLAATVGDECQGVYGSVREALAAALFVRLRLLGTSEVRFGVGWGEITTYDPERAPAGQSGTAWWNARKALDEVKSIESGRSWPRHVRTWIVGLEEPSLGLARAFLITRDALVAGMDERDARIALGLFRDERQAEIADAIGITQPSVARRAADNGPAALYRAQQAWAGTGV
jgi:hypothetical protein